MLFYMGCLWKMVAIFLGKRSNHMGDLCCDCQRSFFVLEYCHILGLVAGEQITIAASCFFNQALSVTSDSRGGSPHSILFLVCRLRSQRAAF